MKNEIVVVSAKRSATGKFKGIYKDLSAVKLGTAVLKDALDAISLNPNDVEYVIMGNVLQAGLGQNPTRQVAIYAGIPFSVPAFTVNEVCGSGLKSIHLGMQQILLGEAKIVAVGGFENMTLSPILNDRFTSHSNDSIYKDGLTDAFSNMVMGDTVESLIKEFNISREKQDLFALDSQKRAHFATVNHYFEKEITPIKVKDLLHTKDEPIRPDTNIDALSHLKTIFDEHGTITAGNASSINDGASCLILMEKKEALKRNIPILATIKSFTEVGIEPERMGLAPIYSINNILNKEKLTLDQIDLFEINESFAGQVLSVLSKLPIPLEKLNVNGGAIALGHPLGSSGSRIVVSLIHELNRQNKKLGLASLCVGGGIGMSLLIEGNVNEK
ncbi:Acetyl-CoA acetyltransferase [Alteracholeplasma palmae J233]|uniref:acetyl-CoA C-acetyltransferase n=1 Tax=Alteracholeplasma palmae (strain ATCC 49389 / J233) TaxID=1318466 RepID=U4KLG3_ALTPJ|nr:thiolase family protein [Alteracholeplasma palmae]CCV64779.1 Acetyl-CoA acetyltransferase [Alteracholeplasma palmae J233]